MVAAVQFGEVKAARHGDVGLVAADILPVLRGVVAAAAKPVLHAVDRVLGGWVAVVELHSVEDVPREDVAQVLLHEEGGDGGPQLQQQQQRQQEREQRDESGALAHRPPDAEAGHDDHGAAGDAQQDARGHELALQEGRQLG